MAYQTINRNNGLFEPKVADSLNQSIQMINNKISAININKVNATKTVRKVYVDSDLNVVSQSCFSINDNIVVNVVLEVKTDGFIKQLVKLKNNSFHYKVYDRCSIDGTSYNISTHNNTIELVEQQYVYKNDLIDIYLVV